MVRGISSIIHERLPNAEFLVPSFDIERDSKQWKIDEKNRINFISAYKMPLYARVWGRLDRMAPQMSRLRFPSPAIPKDIQQQLRDTTAGILTGGDVLSLEYGIPSLLKFLGQAESYMNKDRPLFLWAASVGPFNSQPDVEKYVVNKLAAYAGISVRETSSYAYLKQLGLDNVKLVVDPAFVMKPDSWDTSVILPKDPGEGWLGFNISPLIKSFRSGESHILEMEKAVVEFLHDVLERTNLSVVLIPHVDSVDGSDWNSDYCYMLRLKEQMNLSQDVIATRMSLAPRTMNAVQTKFLISQCRFFIGARTHATIAAWSTHVPTVSISYSIKALGLNTDLFGDLRYVLETPRISRSTLWESLEKLRTDEESIKNLLQQKIPQWQQRAREAADQVLSTVD
ncbi:MAG: polysaccharide pyruvyl transferase family protein [Nitrosomonas sp.]|nr:polysaccharide pyruvyl transferase family protein [Nitrosomonas sp.]